MYKLMYDDFVLWVPYNISFNPVFNPERWQIYQDWLAEGNIPIPADPPPPPNYQFLIDSEERESFLKRGARELHMHLIEKEAYELASENNTVEDILANHPYYVKLKDMNDKIIEWRTHL